MRRLTAIISLVLALAFVSGCNRHKIANPIANVDSKQPDKVLFDRAMDAMNHGKYDVARLTLQTLINTYPDSEFIARAKLAVGDSWYKEGTSAAYQQAEEEYKQFQVFFPNMAEAAEAQMKIGRIHYNQMEKADRDPTQALQAEDAYRQLILQYPDSKLVPEAKEKLREVQEVLAQREYAIGRFYYLRGSYYAAAARLKTLTDTYPLFSDADEALFMLGQSYERMADFSRTQKPQKQLTDMPEGDFKKKAMEMYEAAKVAAVKEYEDGATAAYSRLVSDYPLMDRAKEAQSRLEAMHRTVPQPTQEAVARNKAEIDSRGSETMFGRFLENFHRGPNVASAAHAGEPTLDQPSQTNATDIMAAAVNASNSAAAKTIGLEPAPGTTTATGGANGGASGATGAEAPASTSGGTSKVGAPEIVGSGSGTATNPPPSLPPSQPPAGAEPGVQPNAQPGTQPAPGTQPKQSDTGIDELKPITPEQPAQPAPTTTTPNPGAGGTAEKPAEIRTGISSQSQQQNGAQAQGQQSQQNTGDQASSKSNKKSKKKKETQPPPQ